MPTPPSSRSASPARSLDLSISESLASAPNSPQGIHLGRLVRHGSGQAAQALRDDLHDFEQHFDAGLHTHQRPALPPLITLPPLLAPLLLDGQEDGSELMAIHQVPVPRSRSEIESDFAAMRSAREMFRAAHAQRPGLSPEDIRILLALEEKMRQAVDWQAAFAILDRARARYEVQASDPLPTPDFISHGRGQAQTSIPVPRHRGLILSITDQIDLNRHQADLMRQFATELMNMPRSDLPPEHAISWERDSAMNAGDEDDDWPFAEQAEHWRLQLAPRQTQMTLRASAVQFWGELWSGTDQLISVMIEQGVTTNTLDQIIAGMERALSPMNGEPDSDTGY